jgi:hypothetical protein
MKRDVEVADSNIAVCNRNIASADRKIPFADCPACIRRLK